LRNTVPEIEIEDDLRRRRGAKEEQANDQTHVSSASGGHRIE
jgi:hypothetical protein